MPSDFKAEQLMYNEDSLQYHGIENIEFRNLCVKNKGFTFGYPLSVPAKLTLMMES